MLSNGQLEPPEPPWYESNLLWGPIAFILSAIASVEHDLRWLLWLAWLCFSFVIWRLAKKTREPRLIAVLGILIAGGGLLWLGNWLRPESRDSKADAISSNASPANRGAPSAPSNIVPLPRQPNESGPALATTVKPDKHAFNSGLFRSSASSSRPQKPQPQSLSETALTLAGNIRKLSEDWSTEQSKIDNAADVTDQQRKSMTSAWAVKVMAEYDTKYKVDARIVHDKLLASLPAGTENLAMNDAYESEVNPGWLEIIASDLERLAKLLPSGTGESSPERQSTNNAPNGIAISGGNVSNPTVNNYAPPQRQIPKNIEDELIATLKQYPGEARLNSDSGDFEANTLARQLFSIFESAGWRPIEIGTVMGGAALPPEIQVGYRGAAGTPGQRRSIPEDQPAARAVVQAFLEAGFGRVTIVPNPNQKTNVLLINIGHNTEADVGQ